MPRIHIVESQDEDGNLNRSEFRAPWWVPAFIFDCWMALRMWYEGISEGSKWEFDQSQMPYQRKKNE